MIDNSRHDLLVHFLVRRAFRTGGATRADLMRAAEISTATATRIVSTALGRFAELLERKAHAITPRVLVECPAIAGEEDLMKAIDSGHSEPIMTGLFPDELPVTYVSWSHCLPKVEGAFMKIVRGIKDTKPLAIIYVGLRYKEVPRKRVILPIALEKMGDQWRVVAQDLERKDYPVRTYTLSRILGVETADGRQKIPPVQHHKDHFKILKVRMNPLLSDIQRDILMNELKISNQSVKVASRSTHEFERRFTSKSVAEGVVWPPLEIMDQQETSPCQKRS